jgi:hypothetical protein
LRLAALIAAYQDSEEDGALRATLPVAGRTLLERQVRLAAMAGASPIVLFVERLPDALTAAIDRLRREGVHIVTARGAEEAAVAVQANDRLLLFADGLVADEGQVIRLAGAPRPTLLTIPGAAGDERFERIDARSRWAGLALLDPSLLRDTASTLYDWDLQSTLLRRAVQSRTQQVALADDVARTDVAVALRPEDLADFESRVVERASRPGRGWTSRYLLTPLEIVVAKALNPYRVQPEWAVMAGALFTGLGAVSFLRGWLWAGALLLLLATPLDGTGKRLSILRMKGPSPASWTHRSLPILAASAFLALGYATSLTRGWGTLAIAVGALAFLYALRRERDGHEIEGSNWLAERKGMTWLMLPFAVTGYWTAGLVALAFYAAGSFFWAQSRVHGQISGPDQD